MSSSLLKQSETVSLDPFSTSHRKWTETRVTTTRTATRSTTTTERRNDNIDERRTKRFFFALRSPAPRQTESCHVEYRARHRPELALRLAGVVTGPTRVVGVSSLLNSPRLHTVAADTPTHAQAAARTRHTRANFILTHKHASPANLKRTFTYVHAIV